MAGPVGRARILDHLHPFGVELTRAGGVHRRRQFGAVDHQIALTKVGIGRQESGVDRRPGAAAPHPDAINTVKIRLRLRGHRDQLIHIGRHIRADLRQHVGVVAEVVLLIPPRDAPLFGIGRAQLTPRFPVPRTRLAHAFQHIAPVVGRVRLGRVVDPVVVIDDPTRRPVGPGHIGAQHERVVLARPRGQRGRYLVEIDILGEDVIGDFHPRQILEALQIGDHRIRVGMLVKQKLDAGARMLLPIEIGGQRLGRSHVVQRPGRGGGDAQRAQPLKQVPAAHLSALERGDQVFLFFVHKHVLPRFTFGFASPPLFPGRCRRATGRSPRQG